MMRDEMVRTGGTPRADAIREAQLGGALGNHEVTIGILRERMLGLMREGCKVFVLDGELRSFFFFCFFFWNPTRTSFLLLLLDLIF
jgi:hypothetical protein